MDTTRLGLIGGFKHFYTFLMTFHSVGNVIIPTDSYFAEGLVETTNQW
jgi:hypothetical protein